VKSRVLLWNENSIACLKDHTYNLSQKGYKSKKTVSQEMLEKASQTKHVATRAWSSFDEPSNHDQQRWLTASL
jgi:hypothetical protein